MFRYGSEGMQSEEDAELRKRRIEDPGIERGSEKGMELSVFLAFRYGREDQSEEDAE